MEWLGQQEVECKVSQVVHGLSVVPLGILHNISSFPPICILDGKSTFHNEGSKVGDRFSECHKSFPAVLELFPGSWNCFPERSNPKKGLRRQFSDVPELASHGIED